MGVGKLAPSPFKGKNVGQRLLREYKELSYTVGGKE